jgi:hypothetical protein
METVPEIPERTVREVFTESVVESTEYENGAAERAWQLVLDTWRVIDVASARASVPPTPNRDEWMAALRLAAFRLDHGSES